MKSGSAGVADPSGNQLAADRTWSFSTARPVSVHRLRGERRAGGRRRERPAGRGGDEVPLRRGRLHHGAALLQAAEQHGHARRATSGRARASCSRRPVHGETPRAGSRSSSRTRCRSPRTPPTSPPTTRPRAATAFSQGFFNQGVDRSPLHAPRDAALAAATASTATARAPSPTRASTRPTTGSTRRSTGRSRRTRAGRRSPTRRAGRARRTSTRGDHRGHGDLRRAARARRRSPAPTSPCATRTATPVPADVSYDAQTRVAKLDAQVAARQLHDLHRPAQGRLRRRDRRGGQPAGRRQDLVLHRPGAVARRRARAARSRSSPAPGDPFGRYYAEILRAEGLNEFDVTDGPVTADEARRPQRGAAGLGRRSPTPRWPC